MTAITLNNVTNLQDTTTAENTINTNSAAIVTAVEASLALAGGQMSGNIDTNSNRILNLPYPTSNDEPARWGDTNIAAISTSVTAAAASATAAATSQTAAATSATNASSSASSASTSATSASTSASSASTSATAASTSATNAATSATQAAASEAALAAGITTTSTTSLTIGTGSTTFTVPSGELWSTGMYVMAVDTGTPTNYMHGQVTSYSGTSLVVNVTDTGGSGTYATWTITLSGTQGTAGGGLGSGASGEVPVYTSGSAASGSANLTLSSGALTLGVATSAQGSLKLAGSGSGTTTLAAQTSGGGTMTLQAGSDTLVGRATTDTLTNKTISASSNTLTGVVASGSTSTLTVGYTITPYNAGTQSSGTFTPAAANGNYQYLTNNGAFTLANPAADSAIDILVTNGSSAGTITFSGYTVGSNTGDAYVTTNTNKFILSIRRINGTSTYVWKALQ